MRDDLAVLLLFLAGATTAILGVATAVDTWKSHVLKARERGYRRLRWVWHVGGPCFNWFFAWFMVGLSPLFLYLSHLVYESHGSLDWIESLIVAFVGVPAVGMLVYWSRDMRGSANGR